MGKNGTYYNTPPSASYTDQQGWSVFQKTVTVLSPNYTLTGKVTNIRTGESITSVMVSIPSYPSVETDTTGNYSIPNISTGIYTLTATKTGYANYNSSVNITGDITKNIQMTPYVTINDFSVSPTSLAAGTDLTLTYKLNNSSSSTQFVWLGASTRLDQSRSWDDDPQNDQSVSVPGNVSNYTVSRKFTVPSSYVPGDYDIIVAIWHTKSSDGKMVDRYYKIEIADVFIVSPSQNQLVDQVWQIAVTDNLRYDIHVVSKAGLADLNRPLSQSLHEENIRYLYFMDSNKAVVYDSRTEAWLYTIQSARKFYHYTFEVGENAISSFDIEKTERAPWFGQRYSIWVPKHLQGWWKEIYIFGLLSGLDDSNNRRERFREVFRDIILRPDVRDLPSQDSEVRQDLISLLHLIIGSAENFLDIFEVIKRGSNGYQDSNGFLENRPTLLISV